MVEVPLAEGHEVAEAEADAVEVAVTVEEVDWVAVAEAQGVGERKAEREARAVMDTEGEAEGVLPRALGLSEATSVAEIRGDTVSRGAGVMVGLAGVALGRPLVEEVVGEEEGEDVDEPVAAPPPRALDSVGGWVKVGVVGGERVVVGAPPVADTDGVAGPVAEGLGVGCPVREALPEEMEEARLDRVAWEVGEVAGEREGRREEEEVRVGMGVPAPPNPPLVAVGRPEAVPPRAAPLGVAARTEKVGVVVRVARAVLVEVTDTGATAGAPWEGVEEGEATTMAGVTDTRDRVVKLDRERPVGSRLQSAATAASVLG